MMLKVLRAIVVTLQCTVAWLRKELLTELLKHDGNQGYIKDILRNDEEVGVQ